MKPLSPGRPSEDRHTTKKSTLNAGITFQSPPNSEMSRVCRRS